MVSIAAGKHSLPGRNSWSPDETYALLSWGHVEDQGFYVLDLGTLTMYDPRTPLSSLLKPFAENAAVATPVPSRYISAEVDTAVWLTGRRVQFSGHVWDTKQSGW